VKADGLTVVKGEIVTTEFGKPDGNVTVSLRPKPSDTGESRRHERCPSHHLQFTGTRIWPTGTLASPLGPPVDVVTTPTVSTTSR